MLNLISFVIKTYSEFVLSAWIGYVNRMKEICIEYHLNLVKTYTEVKYH